MRLPPIPRDSLPADLRDVHDVVAELVTRTMPRVVSIDAHDALVGPYPAALYFPRYGIPALQFLAAVNSAPTLPKTVRETAILTVGAAFNARYELYAHEIMGEIVGLSAAAVSTLAAGGTPLDLSEQDTIAHDVARALATGRALPTSTYALAEQTFGRDGVGELAFLIGGYCLIATLLNCFDVPIPDGG